MQRREAVGLFREICECIPDPSTISSVFLMPKKKITQSEEENFELRINGAISGNDLKTVESLLKKRQMILEEKKGSIVIYASEPTPKEIIA